MATDPDDLTVGPVPVRAAGPSRFTPGAVVAGRYRLIALLGRGGMGEVYRADDLTLDQPVALKFLPEGVAVDAARLTQFHNELRTARQVSHKNVCRLYDLGDADGRRFLTMEYVDGEDLASLLRRIGRFPEDRAVTIARQLCAGVAAAHERGVIHRDLKPANVMIDGEGQVRITDFGIATAVDSARTADGGGALAGTPQYMAPEQLTGHAASTKTDIYALGLILFEIFTGKRAYDAKTITDLKSLHDTGTLTTPSAIVRDLDPAIESVILRCLSKDPERRPSTALAVAAALPGGDPLAAALAAGETPSPEMLAAAAETEAMPILQGCLLMAAVVACLAIYAAFSPLGTMASQVPLEKAPAVLADRAQQVLADFGYPGTPVDTAQNFVIPPDFRRWLVETDATRDRWNPARHPMAYGLLFWYRTSPAELNPVRTSSTVSATDPPLVLTGQSLAVLDTKGRLVEFRRVPPQRDPVQGPPPAPDWNPMFRAAGIDRAAFAQVEPEWTPKDFADTRAAWEGPLPDAPGLRLRLEAAAYRGQIVSVYAVAPWTRARAMTPPPPLAGLERVRLTVGLGITLMVLIGALFVARHNVRVNRADRQGAGRLVSVYVVLQLASWIVSAHHLSHPGEEFNSFMKVVAVIGLQSGMLWVLYLAIEPFGRRFWPDGLLGWSRLLSGRILDPRIGREILIGAAFAGALMLVDLFRSLSPLAIGKPPSITSLGSEVEVLNGFGWLFGTWTDQFFQSLESALFLILLLVIARLVLQRTWLAIVVATVVELAAGGSGVPYGGVGWLYYLAQLMAVSLINFAIIRYGVLVTVLMILLDNIPTTVPIVRNGAAWAAVPGNLSMVVVVAAAAFGFYAARMPRTRTA
jgi:hypothetical protein